MAPKFRAWDKGLESMIPVERIDFEYRMINVNAAWRTFEEIELMQSTGLRDKNGVEIFDGDIVVIEYSRVGYRYYEKIIYENGAFLAGDDDWLFNVKDSCVVCGNIYENPELLEPVNEI